MAIGGNENAQGLDIGKISATTFPQGRLLRDRVSFFRQKQFF